MNCHYCQKECLRIDDQFFRCLPCYTDFKRGEINISTRYNGRTWVVRLRYFHTPFKTIIGNAKDPDLIKLPTWADITPQNIQQKLKTYLIFS